MGIIVNDGDSKPVNLTAYAVSFTKVESVKKHGSHDQGSHGAWANGKYNPDDSEGEDEIEPKNYRTPQKLSDLKDDSEGEFEDSNYDDPRHMDDMDLRPYGGAAFAKTWGKPMAVAKHGGGSHDQESHGSWAGNGAGGKNIQDMSASNQKEFIDRMSSAKTTEEQRAIIDEFTNRQKGGAKGRKAPQGKDREAMMRDYDKMEAKWRKKLDEKPYDPENPEYGDPQDLASTDFYRKYGIYPDELPM